MICRRYLVVVNGEDWEGYFETSMGIPDSGIRVYDGDAFRGEIEEAQQVVQQYPSRRTYLVGVYWSWCRL